MSPVIITTRGFVLNRVVVDVVLGSNMDKQGRLDSMMSISKGMFSHGQLDRCSEHHSHSKQSTVSLTLTHNEWALRELRGIWEDYGSIIRKSDHESFIQTTDFSTRDEKILDFYLCSFLVQPLSGLGTSKKMLIPKLQFTNIKKMQMIIVSNVGFCKDWIR